MKLRILKAGTIIEEADVDAVTLPGAAGQLTPMSGHDFLLTPLKEGVIRFRPIVKGETKEPQEIKIEDGIAEILKASVTAFVTIS